MERMSARSTIAGADTQGAERSMRVQTLGPGFDLLGAAAFNAGLGDESDAPPSGAPCVCARTRGSAPRGSPCDLCRSCPKSAWQRGGPTFTPRLSRRRRRFPFARCSSRSLYFFSSLASQARCERVATSSLWRSWSQAARRDSSSSDGGPGAPVSSSVKSLPHRLVQTC